MTSRPALLIRRPDVLEAILPDDSYLTGRIRRLPATKIRKSSRAVAVRVWKLDPSSYAALVAELKEYGETVEVYSPPNASQSRSAASSRSLSDRDVLGVTEAAPWPVVESAYRAMALLYHPDRAGYQETERMKKINLAFERLQVARR